MNTRLRKMVDILILLAIAAWVFWAFDLLRFAAIHFWGTSPFTEIEMRETAPIYRGGLLTAVALLAGLSFVLARHPVFNKFYTNWLRSTPWTSKMPLPIGPVYLTWRRGLFVAALMLLCRYATDLSPMIPLFAFAMGCLGAALLSLAGTLRWAAIPMVFGMIGLIRVFDSPSAIAALLVLQYLIFFASLPRSLDECGWRYNDGKPRRRYVQLGWPLDQLGPSTKTHRQFLIALFAGPAAGWFAYCISYRVFEQDHWRSPVDYSFFYHAAAWIGLLRFIPYFIGCMPPISISARFTTGRPIIPGYDQILIGPILTYLCPIPMVALVKMFPVSASVGVGIVLAATVFVAFACGPSIYRWRLTGEYRMVNYGKNKQSIKA